MSSTSYRKVVIPLDGSPLAEQVLTYVKYVTSPTETALELVSVFDSLRYTSIQLGHGAVRLVASVLANLESYLNQQREKLESMGYRVHTHVIEGDAAYEIVKLAKGEEADLIAMTTHGRAGFVRFALGSVAERVIQRAETPVLLMREVTNASLGKPRRILIPLDGSRMAETALPEAAALAQTLNAQLVLLQVIQPLDEGNMRLLFPDRESADAAQEQWRLAADAYLAQVAHMLQSSGIACEYQAKLGDADQVICASAIIDNIDLIVMSTHGRSGLKRWYYGSVANKVLRNAECPILLVRSVTETALAEGDNR